MFVQAQIDLGTTPFPVARHRLTAYAHDRPTLLRDCQTALHTQTMGGDGSATTSIQVLTAPVRNYPGATMVPVRWLRAAAGGRGEAAAGRQP